MANTDFQRADGFQQAFFDGSADTHNFASCFHLCAQCVCCCSKFVEGETRHFCYDVVQCGFEVCICFGNLDFVQCHTNSDLSCYTCDGVTACFGCQCGRTRYTRVNFDQIVFGGVGVQCELYVTTTFDFQRADDFQSAVTQHVEVCIAQCQDRSHNDGVTCVYTNGVDVFHTADGDGVVCAVTHYFEFDFFVAFYAFFYQYLVYGREFQGVFHDFYQFGFVVCKTAACAAQCECGTQYNGVADFFCSVDGFFNGVCDDGRNYGFADFLTEFFEQFSVFSAFDTVAACAQQFNLAFSQNAFLFQLHCQIQTCLTADTGNDGVGTFITQDFCNIFQCQGFHVNLVCNGCVCHDGSGVGVYQHNFIAFFFQGKASLCACIVKFGSLSDHDGAGADNQNFFEVSSLWHIVIPP